MINRITYDPQDSIQINKISLIGDFNQWNGSKHKFIRSENGLWYVDIDLPPGEYKYKFLINDVIRLNDPFANLYLPDDKGEITSIIIINDQYERMYNTQTYTVHIDKYHLSDEIDEIAPSESKKVFNQTNEKVVCRLEFTKVTGIHTVSVLWFGPNQEFYNMTENVLFTPDEEENKPLILWFWNEIFEQNLPAGNWTLKVFVDGAYVFEDYFTIRATTYSVNRGQLQY